MKKFWIVLLALGLVAGFAMSAPAADVKFSGSYYVMGLYADNPQMRKEAARTISSQAFYHQRLRIQTEFKIAEGLSLVTRFDALEKAWGYGQVGTTDAWRWQSGLLGNSFDVTNRPSIGSNGVITSATARTQENIEWERAYIDFTTKIGKFQVGYQNFIAWGTMFLDTHGTRPGIKYIVPVGPMTIVAALEKTVEQNAGNGIASDADGNVYDLGAIYKFGAGDAGLLLQYVDNNRTRPAGYKTKLYLLNPYARMKFGPVYIEAEAGYAWGKLADSELAAIANVDAEVITLYINAKADLGPAYVGAIFAYMRGDDPATTGKVEGSLAASLAIGQAWDPCLILWNDAIYGAQHRLSTNPLPFFDNAIFGQIYVGFKPVKEADIMFSVSYANADQKPTTSYGKEYGWELDLVGKYKIFDNLEYMIGAGYLIAGDYFKTAAGVEQANNYILFHRLTLSF